MFRRFVARVDGESRLEWGGSVGWIFEDVQFYCSVQIRELQEAELSVAPPRPLVRTYWGTYRKRYLGPGSWELVRRAAGESATWFHVCHGRRRASREQLAR